MRRLITDFRLSWLLIKGVNSDLGLLHRVLLDDFADVSDTNSANMEHVDDVSGPTLLLWYLLPTVRVYILPP